MKQTTLAQEGKLMKNGRYLYLALAVLCCALTFGANLAAAARGLATGQPFPPWTYAMKVWPFDILYFNTTQQDILNSLDLAVSRNANTVIFYIEEEQMYDSFVDETGFDIMLGKIGYLIDQAHARNLKVICYLNGLEVMAHNACGNPSIPTLARKHPEWLQKDIHGNPMAWTCIQNDWITPDMEDAWASPYSGFRDLFKKRLGQLGSKGLDAVYIDQASLPGMQDYGNKWASSDPGFAAAFNLRYNLTVPTNVDWNAPAWRKFTYFRHEAIRDYLKDLADTARAQGIVPFFESSANDTSDGTLLGNEPSFSVTAGIACSPEIEPEGDYQAAFQMAKFARDIDQSLPILYLGWPVTAAAARKEFAIALCQSGNYYPTADAPYPAGAFAFLDTLRDSVLSRRRPYQEVALIYSARNKDWTFPNDATFNLYESAFNKLAALHQPFKIFPLETLTAAALQGIDTLVLPGVASISDAEFNLLASHPVILMGENGTRDEWYEPRAIPLKFPKVVTWESLRSRLPFTLTAPQTTLVEYYTDQEDPQHYFLFAFSPATGGNIVVNSPVSLNAKVYRLNQPPQAVTAASISVAIADYLQVIELKRVSNPSLLELLLSLSSGGSSTGPRNFLSDVSGRQF
jgi:hypothetical protein